MGAGILRTTFLLAALLALAACRAPADPPAAAVPEKPPADDPGQGKWQAADVKALPYLQGYREARERPAVTGRDPRAVWNGLNLYVSGHAAEAVLMDMRGHTLHRWRYPLRRLWPDLTRDPEMAKLEYWRRAYLYPNGDLLAIYEGQGLVKLDAASRVLWAYRAGTHHDLFVAADGAIYVLEREGKVIPWINPREGVLEDFVTVLDPAGKRRRRISILNAFARSPWASLLKAMPLRKGDILHTNTLELLDGRFAGIDPAFRAGNLLISSFALNTVAVLDPEREAIVWAKTGLWKRQHQPTFLDDGHLLVFDNQGAGRDRSRVQELDLRTGKIVWEYGGRPGENLSSKTLGSCQRLPNGNTLITESEAGRALEVTRDGRVVWEFDNPHRAGEHGELVATLFETVRLPPDFPFPGATERQARP